MHDDDIEYEDFDELGPAAPDPDDPPGAPDYRATVVGDRVTLIHWSELLHQGPFHRALLSERAEAGVTIADLTVLETDVRELVVSWLARGGGVAAERALLRWAAVTGHRRVWLPDRVVTPAAPRAFATATTTCPNCGVRWSESGTGFWARVQASGCFPGYCLLCGGDLPQWSTRRMRDGGRRAVRS